MQALTPATFPYLYTRFTYPPSLCLRRLARPLVHPLFSHSCNRAFIFLTIRGAILPLVYGLGTDISLEIIKWRDASSLSLSSSSCSHFCSSISRERVVVTIEIAVNAQRRYYTRPANSRDHPRCCNLDD